MLLFLVNRKTVRDVVKSGSWKRTNEAGVFHVLQEFMSRVSQSSEGANDGTQHQVQSNDVYERKVP